MSGPEDLSFDVVSAVHETDDPDVFGADIHPLWAVGDKANGGYLLALLGRAARIGGPASRRTELGGGVLFGHLSAGARGRPRHRADDAAAQRADGRPRPRRAGPGRDDLVDAVFVLGDLPDETSVRYDGTPAFHAADPEECVRLTPKIPTGVYVGIMDVLDLRLDPATVPFAVTPPAAGTRAELRGWTRFADGRPADALSVLFLTDAIPPATLMIGSTGWVPTLQMSTYVRARPAPGWLAIRMTAGLVADGMVDETCVLWDSRGRLVGQSTQLARLRFPDEVG